ncbi:hypothetical protein K1719_007591 [Acacia pycnantha]|nr:hypothetical protein K1719_007591 [Acacia pycnantha]
MLGYIRSVRQSVLRNCRSRHAGGSRYGVIASAGPNIHQCRLYVQYKFPSEARSSFLHGTKENFYQRISSRSFTAVSASNIVATNSQNAWRRLHGKYSSNGYRTFPSIDVIAQAVSLALGRSSLVVPGIFALVCGELAWTHRQFADAECYPSQNAFLHAQDGLFWTKVQGSMAAELHSKAPEHSFSYTKKTIERSFGRKISEIFENFEEVPVASGSIAQVHRASLKYRYPGQQGKPLMVAVKVRHPGVGESIRRDFLIINAVAKISKLIPTLKWLRLDESVQQFAVFMMFQVDLAREAAHLSRFIYNFRQWKDVSFPRPVYPLVHPAVLVETYEQGESVSHYVDDLQGHERIKTALAHIGTHALLKMLLVDNFIHADMHPGNILVRMSQKSSRRRFFKSKPHVVFLDVGMTAELSGSDRLNLLELFKAVACRDGRTAAECTLRLSKRQDCPNPKAFIEELDEAFAFWGTPEGDLVHPAECIEQLLEKVRRHRVNIDGNVCTVMVTTLVLEGWQRKLDPGYNVMETLQTLVLKSDWAKSLSYTIDGLMAP